MFGLQGDTKPVRRLIEGKFDDVKAATESGGQLPVDLAEWCAAPRCR